MAGIEVAAVVVFLVIFVWSPFGGDSKEVLTTTTTSRSLGAAQPKPCLALAGASTAEGTINVHDVATQQNFAMSTAVFCREAEALRPPQRAPLVMENYVADGRVRATYYRKAKVEKTLEDGTTVLLDGNESTPLSQADAEAVMSEYAPKATAPSRPGGRRVHVGDTATVGPLTVRVEQAVSTVTPHTYVLTMSIKNRGTKPSPLPRFGLGCTAPLSPASFGLTGSILSGDTLAAHELRSGDLILYPQQICENPNVTISRHVIKRPRDQVTYVLRGLS